MKFRNDSVGILYEVLRFKAPYIDYLIVRGWVVSFTCLRRIRLSTIIEDVEKFAGKRGLSDLESGIEILISRGSYRLIGLLLLSSRRENVSAITVE